MRIANIHIEIIFFEGILIFFWIDINMYVVTLPRKPPYRSEIIFREESPGTTE